MVASAPAPAVPAGPDEPAGRAAPGPPRPPTRADLAAARDLTIPDVVAPGLHVLFAGINPGLYSAATGHHFARPGNRFWPALHQSGFTARQLRPDEQRLLLESGLGITNVVARATARADELSSAELRSGGASLIALAASLRVRCLAVLGVTAYRAAFGLPDAAVGPQPLLGAGGLVWVLPNPSGLNAHWTMPRLVAAFRELRAAVAVSGAPTDDSATSDRL
jgi:double-stranded uracil-DNA glycosylase